MLKLNQIPYILFLIGRIAALYTIFVNPLLGWAINCLGDWWDYDPAIIAGLTFKEYQDIDKPLDLFFQLALGVYIWGAKPLGWEIFIILVLWRLAGHIVYAIQHDRQVFVFFPNVGEFYFPIIIIVDIYASPAAKTPILLVALVITTIAKIGIEVLAHRVNWIDPTTRKLIQRYPGHNRTIN